MSRVKISAIEFTARSHEQRSYDVVWAALEAATSLEALGYTRYWVGQHFFYGAAQWSPELMVSLLAAATRSLRIGTAGILLRYANPFKVAADFRLLEAIFPGRIDLGLARGLSAPEFERLLTPTDQAYSDRVTTLFQYLRGTGDLAVAPTGVAPPELWLHGTGITSAELAANNSAGLCVGLFDKGGLDLPLAAMCHYVKHFFPSTDCAAPKRAIALAGICSGDAEERLSEVVRQSPIRLHPLLIGSRSRCRERLRELTDRFETSHVAFVDLSVDPRQHIESFTEFAEAAAGL